MQFKILHNKKMCLIAAGILGVSVGLGGCAGTDVELKVPGMGLMKLGGKKEEKKVAARSGLVIPPSTTKLPNPDEVAARKQQQEQAWPDDPDERKKKLAQLEKKEQQNRKQGLDKDGNPDFDAMQDGGSGGPGLIEKIRSGELFGKKDEDDE